MALLQDGTIQGTPVILDQAVWAHLSSFWTEVYPARQREAFNVIYEAYTRALDAEHARLQEIDSAKSIHECPVYTTRRWMQLNLQKYALMRSWLKYLSAPSPFAPSNGVADLACTALASNHTKHWHINFPFRVSGDALIELNTRRTIELGFPIDLPLCTVHRMETASSGARTGVRLAPGVDYAIGTNGTSVTLIRARPNEAFECEIAFDFSNVLYANARPTVVFIPAGTTGPTLAIPATFGLTEPIHALVLSDPPTGTSIGFSATNEVGFTTVRAFYPNLPQPSTTQVTLPVSLTGSEAVFLFGLELGAFTPHHEHKVVEFTLDSATLGLDPVELFVPPAAVGALPLFGTPGLLMHELRLYISGRLVTPDQYRFDAALNTFYLQYPVAYDTDGLLRVAVEYTEETRQTVLGSMFFHLHYSCAVVAAAPSVISEIFDDGGEFDDAGLFDDFSLSNTLTLAAVVDVETLTVFVNGVRQQRSGGYTAVVANGITYITIVGSTGGATVTVFFRRASTPYIYGLRDIGDGLQYRVSTLALASLTTNAAAFFAAYQKLNPSAQRADITMLMNAANIAAAGGNPLFALFTDEFGEYAGLAVDSDTLPLTAEQMRNIESTDTRLVNIPYLQNRVLMPDARLADGLHYLTVDGEILSTIDLAAPRFAGDPTPGVWWLPILVLDEQLLAKNFGLLVDDVRTLSTAAYRDALIANLHLRYSGPDMQAIHAAACAYQGSPLAVETERILAVDAVVDSWQVTITSDDELGAQTVSASPTDRLPALGSSIFAGQSVFAETHYVSPFTPVTWSGGAMVVDRTADWASVAVGDIIRIRLILPEQAAWDLHQMTPAWDYFRVTLVVPELTIFGDRINIGFDGSTRRIPYADTAALRTTSASPPFAAFNGKVTGVRPTYTYAIRTVSGRTYGVTEATAKQYRAGMTLTRGQPVDPTLAAVYDDVQRPNWHRLTVAQYALQWTGADPAAVEVSDLRCSLAGTPGGYSLAMFSPPRDLPRGTRVTFTSDDGVYNLRGQVVGPTRQGHPELGFYTDVPVAETAILNGTLRVVVLPPAFATHFDYPVASGISSTTTGPLPYGVSSLVLTSATAFPASGRITIAVDNGGVVEIEYARKVANRLSGMHWVDGVGYEVIGLIPAGAAVRLVAEYRETILNPAFVAAVQRRVTNDPAGFNGLAVVNDTNADDYYNVIRTNSAIVELFRGSSQTTFAALLDDVGPAGSDLVVQVKHAVTDTAVLRILDGDSPDRAVTFEPPTLDLEVEGITPTGSPLNVTLDGSTAEAGLVLTITDLNSPALTPYTVAWKIQAATPAGAGATLSRVNAPADEQPLLTVTALGLRPANQYTVQATVTTKYGHKVAFTTRITLDP